MFFQEILEVLKNHGQKQYERSQLEAISACSVASESRPALRVLENVKSQDLQADLIHGPKMLGKNGFC